MYLYIREIYTVNIIYHPTVLREKEKALCEKEKDLDFKSYLISIEREIIKEEKKKIFQSKKLKVFTILISFLLGVFAGICF